MTLKHNKCSVGAMNRGSEWNRWEPHIHAPGTVLADQYTEAEKWHSYLLALETATPTIRAIGITDYCVTRSYELVKEHRENGRLQSCELLFPNIELRLATGTVKGNFVNVHLLASPEDPNHVIELNRFLSQLRFEAHRDVFACTPDDLRRLGRKSNPDISDDEVALRHGCNQFKISRENLVDAYREMGWAQENIVIAVAGGADGTSGVKEAGDATLREEIECAAQVIFASSLKQRDFWLGHGVESLAHLRRRYNGPKPCLWGSDAHQLARVAKPDEDRYCWIKGKATFDALHQARVDPERAYVGTSPPSWAVASQVIDELAIQNASWAQTPIVRLNPGLVAIIGARGSGKTALVDMIAAGCDSYTESLARPSFLVRAREHLTASQVSLKWMGGDNPVTRPLEAPINNTSDSYPRARYLSQQFVEDLCSIEGMPSLIREIERVIFEAHAPVERDGAVDFDELLNMRAGPYRDIRAREEAALASISDQIGREMEKTKQIQKLKAQIKEKQAVLVRYENDRKSLLPKGQNKTAERLQEVREAAEQVRSYLRYYANQQNSILGLNNEVMDLRQNRAPESLRLLQEQYQNLGFEQSQWENFLINYTGDVDETLSSKQEAVTNSLKNWKGAPPTTPVDKSGAFIGPSDDLKRTPLSVLEAEIARLEKLVAADRETARKLAAVSKRIAEETASLQSLKERLEDCEGAFERANKLAAEREEKYIRVFNAVIGEERILTELYAPLMHRLMSREGTLAKLSFSVSRVVDVEEWARQGETNLFDLRGGPFKGIGSLKHIASEMLADSWKFGDSTLVSESMSKFREKYQDALLERAPYSRTDQANYRPWTRRFAQWLYSTNHISIEYGIQYDGVDIQKLSPGTRGIVLVLLYLALDDADDRPLIIDQPEENLDPKSIYDELVPLFLDAKRKRQVIMVTHNANLVVNTDADQIIVAEVGAHSGSGLPPITYHSGGLDEEAIRKVVCDILEGGEEAFKDRARRLRIGVSR
jgi:energy-coupling factor transporter ATP-binding protein EcfA2